MTLATKTASPVDQLVSNTKRSNGTRIALNFIGGTWVESTGTGSLPVTNPSTGKQLAQVPLSSARDVDAAVNAAEAAFQSWSATPIKERAQVFYRYKTLMERQANDLASLVREENGKTMGEAAAEIEKAIEVTEFACAMPQLIAGEILEVSRGVEC
ncbi:MAG TPA: aldehyde dehydrogenase family protein, partial [Bacteroidota bacterium]